MKFLTSKIFLFSAIAIICFWIANDRHFSKHIGTYFIVSLLLYLFWQIGVPVIERQLLLEKAFAIIKKHEIPLSINRRRLLTPDDYGNVFDKKWQKEKDYFIKHTIRTQLSTVQIDLLELEYKYEIVFRFLGYVNPYDKILNEIDTVAIEKNIHHERNLQFFEDMPGEAYEHLCKDVLNKSGWDVELTKRVGDQGVDLIAIKNNVRVAIQCKRYKKNIGNSAVQEIVSGKILYKADYGVVVTNTSYTKSAKELADAANIRLLHHYHLLEDGFYL